MLDPGSLEQHASIALDRLLFGLGLSSDGHWLGVNSGSELGLIDVIQSREVAGTNTGHERITGVAISPDSRLVASGAAGGRVELWRVPDLSLVGYLGRPRGAGTVGRLAFSPDGQLLAVNWRIGQLECFDVQTRESTGWVDTRATPIDLAFSHDGLTLACTTTGGVILICDASPLQVRGTLRGHLKTPFGFALPQTANGWSQPVGMASKCGTRRRRVGLAIRRSPILASQLCLPSSGRCLPTGATWPSCRADPSSGN